MSWHENSPPLCVCQFTEIKPDLVHRSLSPACLCFAAEVKVALPHTELQSWSKTLALSLKENSGQVLRTGHRMITKQQHFSEKAVYMRGLEKYRDTRTQRERTSSNAMVSQGLKTKVAFCCQFSARTLIQLN